MAETYPPHAAQSPGRPARSGNRGLVLDTDRTQEFRRAARHTLLVRILRRVLPLFTIGIIGSYVATGFSNVDLLGGLDGLSIPKISAENLTMENPRYEGFTETGGSYRVTALKARQDFAKPDLIQLEGISGDMLDAARQQTRLEAKRGVFNSKKNELSLSGGIQVVTTEGNRAILRSALVRMKAGIITSREPVQVISATAQIDAKRMLLNQKTKEVQFAGDVVTVLQPAVPTAGDQTEAGSTAPAATASNAPGTLESGGNPDAEPAPAPAAKRGSGLLAAGNSSPVRIESTALDVNDIAAVAVFSGDVKAAQDGQTLQTKTLRVIYARAAGSDAPATPAPPAAAGSATPFGGQGTRVTEIVADHPVLITRATGEQVTSDKARFDVSGGKAEFVGTVVMTTTTGRRVAADRADLDEAQDTALMVGNVVVNDAGNELRGERLSLDRAKGITVLSALEPKGRITASLNRQSDATTARAAATTTPAASPATAATPAGTAVNISAFKADPKAPIDIEADTLQVDDTLKAAVFRGAVAARQGAFKLTTSVLTANYTGGGGLAEAGAAPAGTRAEDQSAGKLTRILARGKVVMGSENGQNATGDWADFDVAANTAILGGDVVLSQGKNIVRGTRLKVDLATGKAVIETAPETVGAAWASTLQTKGAEPVDVDLPTGPAGRGARPSAVFYPKELRTGGQPQPTRTEKAKAPAAGSVPGAAGSTPSGATAPAQAASSWEATTEPQLPEETDETEQDGLSQ
ncbi:MAG: LPS export ABC transporter periplasmic protein LptC [Hyphomicrobiaceae bacterium]|nr:LPS export ABC transporter periplasmic protein LptC [Hyphomicrobiaceae bacterium]